jgi:hypothetical protein
MSDELLRHLALNAGKLSKTKHFDPALNTERERLEGGTWLRLLGGAVCYHANQKERQVWCGIARLAKEAGCNTDSDLPVPRTIGTSDLVNSSPSSQR